METQNRNFKMMKFSLKTKKLVMSSTLTFRQLLNLWIYLNAAWTRRYNYDNIWKNNKNIADHPSIRNIIKEKFKTANKFSFRPANKDIVWYCKKVANKSSSKWRIKVLEENNFFPLFSKLHQWRCYQLWVPWPLKIN